jgi:thioredoxin reductase
MQVMGRLDPATYDVVVVGGGAAGLSGALMLGRARRSVLIIDAGEPRNAPASGVHGFLTRDGMNPAALLEAGRAEVRRYGAQVLDGRVASAAPIDSGFTVELEDGCRVGARRLLVTTGLVDELPDVPGVRERWGRDVLHCPYCHGWEVRDQPIGVLASNSRAAHQALLFRQWTADLTLFLHTAPQPTDAEAEQLAACGITVVEGEVASLEIVEDRLTGVQMRSGEVVARRAVALMPRFVARAEMLAGLGLEATVHPLGVGENIDADATGLTAVPGVWVAGNVADLIAGVVGAADAGARAGVDINADLIAEDTHRAVADYRVQRKTQTVDQREPFSAEAESEVCERVLGDRRHGL